MKKVRMKDIAERVGVSVQAVSLALKGDASIPEKRRDEIKAIAEEMGYERDPYLQGLVKYRTKAPAAFYTILVVCFDRFDPQKSTIHRSVKNEVESYGGLRQLKIHWCKEKEFQKMKPVIRYDGIILYGTSTTLVDTNYSWETIPLLSVMSRQESLECAEVIVRLDSPVRALLLSAFRDLPVKPALLLVEGGRKTTNGLLEAMFMQVCKELNLPTSILEPGLLRAEEMNMKEGKRLWEFLEDGDINVVVGAGFFRRHTRNSVSHFDWLSRTPAHQSVEELSFIDLSLDDCLYGNLVGLKHHQSHLLKSALDALLQEIEKRRDVHEVSSPFSISVDGQLLGDLQVWREGVA